MELLILASNVRKMQLRCEYRVRRGICDTTVRV